MLRQAELYHKYCGGHIWMGCLRRLTYRAVLGRVRLSIRSILSQALK